MTQPMTLPLIGALALAGIGAGVHLGHSALAEINPIYYAPSPTRFHSDLVANPPSFSAPALFSDASADTPGALGTGCVGCRTYPEEYRPIHDATVDDESGVYASDGGKVRVAAAIEEEPDPEVLRLQREIARVAQYAQGNAAPAPQFAAAEFSEEPGGQPEALPVTQ